MPTPLVFSSKQLLRERLLNQLRYEARHKQKLTAALLHKHSFALPQHLKLILGFQNNVQWNKLHEVRVLNAEDFVDGDAHKELGELINLPLPAAIHPPNLIVNCIK